MLKTACFLITAAILSAYGAILTDALNAGHWHILALCLIATLWLIYLMSPEDRPTFHRAFNWMLRR